MTDTSRRPGADTPVAPGTSVIICSRGRPALLTDAVTAVLRMTLLPAEVVVVDQSDEQNTALAALVPESPVRVRYLWAPDRGLSRARNVGLAAASGDVLAFLDDDMLVAPDWLDACCRALAGVGARHVVTGRIPPGDPEVPGAWAPSTNTDAEPRAYSGRLRMDVFAPGNMAMPRSAYDDAGPFDERLGAGTVLPSAEDNDYGYRLLRLGYTIDYRPEVVAVHRAWRDEGAYSGLRYDYGRGQGGFYAKHITRGDVYMVRRFASDVYRHLRRSVRRARTDPVAARGDLAYTRGLLRGAIVWLRLR